MKDSSTKSKQEPRLWTVEDAADFLRVSRRTVLRSIHAGELPARKVRRQWQIGRASCRERG